MNQTFQIDGINIKREVAVDFYASKIILIILSLYFILILLKKVEIF
jgi:hypothetical protein